MFDNWKGNLGKFCDKLQEMLENIPREEYLNKDTDTKESFMKFKEEATTLMSATRQFTQEMVKGCESFKDSK